MSFYAHTPNETGHWHDLSDHLQGVSRLAAGFAQKFAAEKPAYWAGMWHDLGKYHPGFQQYLEDCYLSRMKKTTPTKSSVPHAIYGALAAARYWDYLAFLVAGHHGGLPNLAELKGRLREIEKDREAVNGMEKHLKEVLPEIKTGKSLPAFLSEPLSLEFMLRMLFSCLVDADFLDTEKHFDYGKSSLRSGYEKLGALWEKFEKNQEKLIRAADGSDLNKIRLQIYRACLEKAAKPTGIFRLTVPTGGGKTRSALGFALMHALLNGLDRVIVAIPYTSIIDQTVDVYRDILGEDAVLEHHSAVETANPEDYQSPVEIRRRLASENWEWPLVVTTTVQLFESLFHNNPGQCRKLHNIARSVVILDEVQTLPLHLLKPILNVLQELADNYRVSVVLCTATQPAFSAAGSNLGIFSEVEEIISEPAKLYRQLNRVSYEIHKEPWSWERVAGEMGRQEQVMTVVNSRRDALKLTGILGHKDVLHLSALLCGAHRREVLKQVRQSLERGAPCKLVSTQVVEAGVDIDFPVVLRAAGPLDRIVQAAGRCNREARMPGPGRVVVFTPAEGSAPSGAYRSGMQEAAMLLSEPECDLHDPETFEKYFRRLYQDVDTDAKKVQQLRKGFNYRDTAEKFRLIEDCTLPVLVPYGEGKKMIESLITSGLFNRQAMRRLQPYLVNIYRYQLKTYLAGGFIEDLGCELYVWKGGYDPLRGLTDTAMDPSDLVF